MFSFCPPSTPYSPGAPQSSTALYLTRFPLGGVLWTQRSPRETPGSDYCRVSTTTWCLFYLLPVNSPLSRVASANVRKYLARFVPWRRSWDRSLPPPVADEGRRSVGNRKERRHVATMRVPRVAIQPWANARESRSRSVRRGSASPFENLIRHGCAVPPSPPRGRHLDLLYLQPPQASRPADSAGPTVISGAQLVYLRADSIRRYR